MEGARGVYRVQFEVAETTEQVFVGPDSIFIIINYDSVRFSTSGKTLFENEIHGTSGHSRFKGNLSGTWGS